MMKKAIAEVENQVIPFAFDEYTQFIALLFSCADTTGYGKAPTLEYAIQEFVNNEVVKKPYTHLLAIEMPCGNVLSCKSADDIPRQDTPCPCGNPHHWLVKIKGCL